MIPYPLTATVYGREWKPYAARFETADGEFEFHLYATDLKHAEKQLRAARATARIVGQVDSAIPTDLPFTNDMKSALNRPSLEDWLAAETKRLYCTCVGNRHGADRKWTCPLHGEQP